MIKRKITNVQLFIAAWRTQSGDCLNQVYDFFGMPDGYDIWQEGLR